MKVLSTFLRINFAVAFFDVISFRVFILVMLFGIQVLEIDYDDVDAF